MSWPLKIIHPCFVCSGYEFPWFSQPEDSNFSPNEVVADFIVFLVWSANQNSCIDIVYVVKRVYILYNRSM